MSKAVTRDGLKEFIQEAKTWEVDREERDERETKRGYIIGAIGVVVGLCGLAVGYIAVTQPPPEPWVYQINETTGSVSRMSRLSDGADDYGDVLNKYWLQQYVKYRVGYSRDLAETYYKAVGLMSSGEEQQRYFQEFNPKNPKSPLNVLGEYGKVNVTIKSTSFISSPDENSKDGKKRPKVALVRYTKTTRIGTSKPEPTEWAATVTFRYSNAPSDEKDREVNPLGFTVVEWRPDPDAADPAGRHELRDVAPAPTAVAPRPQVAIGATVPAPQTLQ